jgi:hypothetical protein
MLQPGSLHGLVSSSKDKNPIRISAAALELLSHENFKSQMTKLQCHELQVRAINLMFSLRLFTQSAGMEK